MKSGEDFWTKPNRKTVVRSVSLEKLSATGDRIPSLTSFMYPPTIEAPPEPTDGKTVWALVLHTQVGMSEPKASWIIYKTESEARDAASRYRIGEEIQLDASLSIQSAPSFDVNNLCIDKEQDQEPPTGDLYEALVHAGVLTSTLALSRKVSSWIGEAGYKQLEATFGDDAYSVAAHEYCKAHFHETSLASLASQVLVSYFVGQNDFNAGYQTREFQMLYSGAEELAVQEKQMRNRRADAGGRTSEARKKANLEALMIEIEKLADCAGKIDEKYVLQSAIDNAQSHRKQMPKTPKTIETYLTTLRSEEPYRTRYNAVFRKNA